MLVLGLISALGSMAIHMLAPALPLLQRSLDIDVSEAQLVISVYLVSLGIGQFLFGPLVDRLGRMTVLYSGLALFAAGSVVAMLAPSFEWLLAARALQAVGGAACLVCSRALVADIFGNEGGARHQAKLMTVVLISPSLSPLIGAYLASWGGWQTIFVVLAAIALITLAIVMSLIQRRIAHLAAPPRRGNLIADIGRLGRNRAFVLATATLAAGSSALYIFLTTGAFLLEQQFGLGERSAGLCFLLVAVAGIAGTLLVRSVDRWTDPMVAGCICLLAGSASLLLLAAAGVEGPGIATGCMMVLGVGAGLVGPSAIHIAVSAEAGLAGTGASIAGSVQMLASGAATIPAGWASPVTSAKLGLTLTVATSCALCAALLRYRWANDMKVGSASSSPLVPTNPVDRELP